MGERLNGAKGQIPKGSRLKKRGTPCRLCAERLEDEAAAVHSRAWQGKCGVLGFVMSRVASCSSGAGGARGWPRLGRGREPVQRWAPRGRAEWQEDVGSRAESA